jgi:hypothetical protein
LAREPRVGKLHVFRGRGGGTPWCAGKYSLRRKIGLEQVFTFFRGELRAEKLRVLGLERWRSECRVDFVGGGGMTRIEPRAEIFTFFFEEVSRQRSCES